MLSKKSRAIWCIKKCSKKPIIAFDNLLFLGAINSNTIIDSY